MLLQRVVTSFALLLLILVAVFTLPSEAFCLFVALVISAGVWEWSSLSGLKSMPAKIAYLLMMLLIMFLSIYLKLLVEFVLLAGVFWWLMAFLMIRSYPGGHLFWSRGPMLLFIGVPLFIPGWLAILYLRDQETYAFHLLFFMAMVAAADIGAYFVGRWVGTHKLALNVSPNKTWEGFAGGLLACSLLIIIAAQLTFPENREMTPLLWVKLIISALLIATFSVVGDLFESMVKRFRDVKDSGGILPGHGGVLDRIDGLTSAAPLYALILMLLAPEFT